MNEPQPTPDPVAPDPVTDPPPGPERAEDGIGRLAKMSTTAGLGNEYRAVSALAVVAVSLAVLGVSALLVDALLILPAAAVILAVVAMVRIRTTGGTQTGFGLSVIGLLLGGVVLVVGMIDVFGRTSEHHREVAGIEKTVDQIESALIKDDYATAYEVGTHPRFKARIDEALWANAFTGMQAAYGNLTSVKTTGLINFERDGDIRYAQTKLVFTVENRDEPLQHMAIFSREGDAPWQLSSIPDVFQ